MKPVSSTLARGACVLATVLSCLAVAVASAAAAPPPQQAQAPAGRPHLLGTWGGARTWLEERGLTPRLQYIWFPAYNLTGGRESEFRQAGQLTFGVTGDLGRLAGMERSSFQVLINKRHGDSLSDEAQLGLLNHAQAIFGAGQNWRLSQLFYRYRGERVDFKVGRMSMGEDFATGECYFESLYFCGTKPSHTFGGYFYNPPTSVWGTRLAVHDRLGDTQIGVYELNPINSRVDRGFYLGFGGRTGWLVPVERSFDVALGADGALEGTYRIGAWFDTSTSSDLVRDVDGGLAALSGRAARDYHGRMGAYFVARQQVRAAGDDGTGAVSMFFTAVKADERTTRISHIVTAGAIVTGVFAARPQDQFGLGIGRARASPRLEELVDARNALAGTTVAPQRAEWGVEANYAFNIRPGLSIRPNIQWYAHPGGRRDRENVLILGTGIFLVF